VGLTVYASMTAAFDLSLILLIRWLIREQPIGASGSGQTVRAHQMPAWRISNRTGIRTTTNYTGDHRVATMPLGRGLACFAPWNLRSSQRRS
jgi:hypothetical protein